MQRLMIKDGTRQVDFLDALTAHIADAPVTDRATPAVLAASGPVLSNLSTQSPGVISAQLAPGLYAVSGRLVDTRTWPDTARTLTLPGINDASLPARVMLSATWRQRFWSIGGPDFDAGAAALDQSSPPALPLDDVACVSEEPVLRIAHCKSGAQPDALCLGQIIMTAEGDLRIDDAWLPAAADISSVPAIKHAVLKWLQPVFMRVDALDQARFSTDRALSGAIEFRTTQVSLWAEATRQSMDMVGAVDMLTVVHALRASMERIAAKIDANQLPPVEPDTDGFDLRAWLPTTFLGQAIDIVSDAVAAELVPPASGLVLHSDQTKVSYADGMITVHAALEKTLDEALGLTGHASAIRISVEPVQPDVTLYPTGTALLHPHAQANRLPAALGRIPLAGTASGGVFMHVPLSETGFDDDIDEVISADAFRLVIAADPDGDIDCGALPVTLTLSAEH